MPITGSYSWSEKNDLIKIVIPLKGTPIKTVDIFVTSNTLKVNFSPYIVDIVLSSSVDALKHKATVKDGNLQITLYKTTNSTGLWGTLEINSDDKALLSKLREDSLLKQDVLEKDLGDKRRDRRIDDERYSLRKQMGLDEAERNRLDVLKLDEKQAAEEEVYATFARMNYTTDINKSSKTTQDLSISALSTPQVKEAIDFETYLRDKEIRTSASKSSSAAVVKESKDIFEDSCIEIIDIDGGRFDDDDTDYTEAMSIVECSTGIVHHPSSSSESNTLMEKEVDDVRFIPPPRVLSSTGKVNIQFTSRIFPTPMRESKVAEEDDWIAKNRRHLKKHGVFGKNATAASKLEDGDGDPVWLKAKGDDFFRGGDFLSALNAYSAAIDIDEGMTACYSNRSACYLKLKMFAECLLDCTEVVKQIDAELASISTSNSTATALSEAVRKEIIALKVMLSKSLLRRGSTSCQMGAFANALNDYTRTNNLLFGFVGKRDSASHNSETSKDEDVEFCLPTVTKASLAADLDRIIKLNSADLLKKEGDNLFAEGKLSESWLKYGEALQLVPVHVSCLSNRSACSLARKDIQGCIDDCSCALALLNDSDTSSLQDDNHINMLNTILPSVGSEKRKSWVLKILARRGAAYVQLSLLDEAVEDFRSASGLDPTNEALKSDLNKIINYRDGKERN